MNMSIVDLESLWLINPFGIALISKEGTVHAVNPAFEKNTEFCESKVVGLSEAAFDALVCKHSPMRGEKKHRRVEILADDLRAVYFFGDANNQTCAKSGFAELIREPLASIYGFAELLLTQNYDEETRLMLTKTLLEQVNVVSSIVTETLG
jgi:hypothetical protein